MATVLNLSVLNTFMPIFSWILAFLLVFGFLEVTQMFKNKGIHALLAFVFSIMVAVSGTATAAIAAMAPWFLIMIFIIFIVYLMGNFMGIESGAILNSLGGSGAIWWILILSIIILAAGLSQVLGQSLLQAREGGNITTTPGNGATVDNAAGHGQTVLLILTHPKVLGMVLLFFIGALTIALMTGSGA